MTTFLLIITIYGGGSIGPLYFHTEGACENAAVQIKMDLESKGLRSITTCALFETKNG